MDNLGILECILQNNGIFKIFVGDKYQFINLIIMKSWV